MILVPKRELIVPVSGASRMRGKYKLEAVNQGDGRRRLLADWFPNLITNTGLDALGSSGVASDYLTTCCVGSGTTAPSYTDTSLVSLIASTTTTNSFGSSTGTQSAAPYYGYNITQFNFAAGTATGNLSEIGVGVNATSLFSRALILDSSGNPTTITVLSNEALYATYEVQQYVPTADVTGSITINGVVYDYTLRAANATGNTWAPTGVSDSPQLSQCTVFNGTIGAITGQPSGSQAYVGSTTSSAYTQGSYTLESTANFGLTNGNVTGGISAVLLQFGTYNGAGRRGSFQASFSPAIPKDSSHTMTLVFSTSWARG